MMAIPSVSFGLEQRVSQVDKQSCGDEPGERIVEDHDDTLLKLVAGINVGDRHGEQGEPDRQHDDVHHGNAPALRIHIANGRDLIARDFGVDQERAESRYSRPISCHCSRRNARGGGRAKYRNLIYVGDGSRPPNVPMPALCRRGLFPSRIHRRQAHIWPMKREKGETSMSVVHVDERPAAESKAIKREGFWNRLAQALDRHFSDRSKRAIPPIMVRRSKHDINRCRRMMRENGFKQALAPAGAGFSEMSHHRVARVPR